MESEGNSSIIIFKLFKNKINYLVSSQLYVISIYLKFSPNGPTNYGKTSKVVNSMNRNDIS